MLLRAGSQGEGVPGTEGRYSLEATRNRTPGPRSVGPPQHDGGLVAIEEITVEELAARMAHGVVLVDVREDDELVAVRVPGVQHIPLGELSSRIAEIPEGHVYVICRSGARSLAACEELARAGRSATNISGGTLAWIDSGRETESG